MDAQLYRVLVKLAQTERKTLTELTRELIERGLGKKTTPEAQLIDEFRLISAELSELTARAVKAGAAAYAYSTLATRFTNETMNYVITQQALDNETKKQRSESWEKYRKKIQEEFLLKPFEQL